MNIPDRGVDVIYILSMDPPLPGGVRNFHLTVSTATPEVLEILTDFIREKFPNYLVTVNGQTLTAYYPRTAEIMLNPGGFANAVLNLSLTGIGCTRLIRKPRKPAKTCSILQQIFPGYKFWIVKDMIKYRRLPEN
ncbi:hypothetical protein A2154_01785 [Candidatus Gottesmanbacteria bacterium RBG_16_43_7]|uniref:Uncharacterized protein n=1 Tax=Candidatus Gottesmanbacteria bacterium RBG_16_43_7 TaxID=1798373 RepID=A0A1F5Z954_9BACT|nr:MAG: hypothetical protein A2154_01785 [Candidatus Gottesmanbacteria bacterium RBG_16_43_7]